MVFRVEVVCMATLQQQISDKFLAKTGGVEGRWRRQDRAAENLLADTKSLSTPDQNQQINDLVAW